MTKRSKPAPDWAPLRDELHYLRFLAKAIERQGPRADPTFYRE